MKNNLIIRAFLDALGVVAYITLFALGVHYFAGTGPDGPFSMILVLTLFIVSACVTGSLVLLKPLMLYHEGMKKEGLQMFAYTVGFLAVLAFVIGFFVRGSIPAVTDTVLPIHCGGNMKDAASCPAGYRCLPPPELNAPTGDMSDMGGICVPDPRD